jgi:hypothetical protein
MENKETPSTKSWLTTLLGGFLFVIGFLFVLGGILFPEGDAQAIGLGVELQIFGVILVIFNKK